MSYILEALKKAEKNEGNRQRLQLDNIGSVPKDRHKAWRSFCLSSILVGGVVIALQFGIWDEQSEIPDINPAKTNFASNISETNQHKHPKTTSPPSSTVSELPKNVKNQIMAMEFSSHIYSQDSSLRLVTIDNLIYRENDQIAKDLYLEEINEIGIIISYHGYLAEVAFLDDWLNISNP